MVKFSLFGIPVSIHWMFWLLAAFLGGALRVQDPSQWPFVLAFMVAATFSILVHEFGHALTGLRFGAERCQIVLYGMGGFASFERSQFSRKEKILMTAAGPGASLLLSIVGSICLSFLKASDPGQAWSGGLLLYFFDQLFWINLFWSVINLMPIFPMDGGQILNSLLGPSRLRLTCIISFITLGVLAVALWMWTGSFFNLIVMAFLASQTWKLFQTTQAK